MKLFNIFKIINKKEVIAEHEGKMHRGLIISWNLCHITILFDGSTLMGIKKYKLGDFGKQIKYV